MGIKSVKSSSCSNWCPFCQTFLFFWQDVLSVKPSYCSDRASSQSNLPLALTACHYSQIFLLLWQDSLSQTFLLLWHDVILVKLFSCTDKTLSVKPFSCFDRTLSMKPFSCFDMTLSFKPFSSSDMMSSQSTLSLALTGLSPSNLSIALTGLSPSNHSLALTGRYFSQTFLLLWQDVDDTDPDLPPPSFLVKNFFSSSHSSIFSARCTQTFRAVPTCSMHTRQVTYWSVIKAQFAKYWVVIIVL